MSIRWSSYVWETATTIQSTELLVLLAIADHSGDDGKSFPSVRRLASRARCDERTVFRALASLEAGGWLQRKQRPGHSTIYQLLTPDTGVTPDKMSPPPTPDTGATPPLTRVSPTPDVGVTHNRQVTTNEPGGVVATTEGGAADRTPPVTQHVTEVGFPRWAQAILASRHPAAAASPEQQTSWSDAWAALSAQRDTLWDPNLHLTRYLSRCEETRRTPNAAEWQRWFADDEMDAKRKGAAAAKAEQDQIKPINPYWE